MIHINAINGIFLHEAVECTLLCKYCTYEKTDLSFLKIFGSCLLYVGTQYAYPLFVRILTSCKMYVIHTSFVGTRNA